MAIVQLILWNQADPSMQKHEDMHQHGDMNIMAISIIWKNPAKEGLPIYYFLYR